MSASIVICDSERAYAEHLMEYLRRKLAVNYEIEMFTSSEKMMSLFHSGGSALLIISEKEYDPGIKEAGFSEILVLNESGDYLGKDVINCSKYQSIDTITVMVRQLCAVAEVPVPGSIRHVGPMHILGVYTPITRCLQTTFSLTMGQILARKGRTLYLNFEDYSGLDGMLGRTFRGSMSDLLYYNECAREKLSGQLDAMVESLGELDFIPPMKSFLELRTIREDQWMDLFRSLEQVTEYEYLILDLSEQIEGLLTILRASEQVFTIVREDAVSRAKIRGYEKMLQSYGCEDIAAKTKRWQFPVFRELPASLENLTHGEMADSVRELLGELGY